MHLKETLAENKPYDDGSHMLAATARFGREEMERRDITTEMQEWTDSMSNTVRVFLGTSLECAQCHDHPFDRRTSKQFFEMAAYTYGAHKSVNKVPPNFGNFPRWLENG